MKELYHCTQNELDKQDENILSLHFEMLMSERKYEFIQQKRQEQKIKSSNKK